MNESSEIKLLRIVVQGELRDRGVAFKLELRRINENFASRGVVGGAHIDAIFNACIGEAEARLRLMLDTIKRNILDTTYDIEVAEILAVFDSALPIDGDLKEAIQNAIRVSAGGSAAGYTAAFKTEVDAKIRKFRAELELFATSPRRGDSQSLTVQGDAGHVQTGGVSNVNQYISSNSDAIRNNGAIGQVLGLLDLVETRVDNAVSRNSIITTDDVNLFEQVFNVAYSIDVSSAANVFGINVGALYRHLHEVQAQCKNLASIHEEFMEFFKLEQQGHFYQSGPARREAFVKRRDAAVELLRREILAARSLLTSLGPNNGAEHGS